MTDKLRKIVFEN